MMHEDDINRVMGLSTHQPQPRYQWKRTVLYVLAAIGFVALTLLVTGKLR